MRKQAQHALEHARFSRRNLMLSGLTGASCLTPLSHLLAAQADREGEEHAQSLILLWMAGGPSQLETFDPQPGKEIAAGTTAIKTAVPKVKLATGFEQLADEMGSVSLIRSMVSKEGDHERGTYTVKTGYRPDPTAVHPSIGAILCHEMPEQVPGLPATEIPRHISILPNQWPGRGGFLGDQHDAFKTWDPANPIPDVRARVSDKRFASRMKKLDVIERAFAQQRFQQWKRTLHRQTVENAHIMMNSDQLKAFHVDDEPQALQEAYGDTPFGRGCLAARRLIEVGVRCVEVTLNGWDSHANNHETQKGLVETLDPAFATLIRDLRERDLLRRTIVLCVGEFGRTPRMNRLEGRDHWPHGFSLAVAGGGLRPGVVIGETDPEGGKEVKDPVYIGDLYTTLLTAMGLNPQKENISRVNRPIKLADGNLIEPLLG